MDAFIQTAKALADPTRVRMLKLLEAGELCVCQIMAVLALGQSTASKHLGILKRSGLVEARKNGTWAYYRLAEKAGGEAAACLALVAKQLNGDGAVNGDRQLLAKLGKRGAVGRRVRHE